MRIIDFKSIYPRTPTRGSPNSHQYKTSYVADLYSSDLYSALSLIHRAQELKIASHNYIRVVFLVNSMAPLFILPKKKYHKNCLGGKNILEKGNFHLSYRLNIIYNSIGYSLTPCLLVCSLKGVLSQRFHILIIRVWGYTKSIRRSYSHLFLMLMRNLLRGYVLYVITCEYFLAIILYFYNLDISPKYISNFVRFRCIFVLNPAVGWGREGVDEKTWSRIKAKLLLLGSMHTLVTKPCELGLNDTRYAWNSKICVIMPIGTIYIRSQKRDKKWNPYSCLSHVGCRYF